MIDAVRAALRQLEGAGPPDPFPEVLVPMSSRPAATAPPRINPIPPRAIVAIVTTALASPVVQLQDAGRLPPRTARRAGIARQSCARPVGGARLLVGDGCRRPDPRSVRQPGSPPAVGERRHVYRDRRRRPEPVRRRPGARSTFAGGKITDVKALQLPFDRRRSAADQPVRRAVSCASEALQAQSAQIDLISGATTRATRTPNRSVGDRQSPRLRDGHDEPSG